MLCPAKRSVVANLMRYSDARIPFLYLFSGSDAKTAKSRIRLFRSALKRYRYRVRFCDQPPHMRRLWLPRSYLPPTDVQWPSNARQTRCPRARFPMVGQAPEAHPTVRTVRRYIHHSSLGRVGFAQHGVVRVVWATNDAETEARAPGPVGRNESVHMSVPLVRYEVFRDLRFLYLPSRGASTPRFSLRIARHAEANLQPMELALLQNFD